jgi:hypothetical protein
MSALTPREDRLPTNEGGKRLKDHLFGRRWDLGMVGTGTDRYFVYIHARRSRWLEHTPSTWEGVPVTWHFNVGRPVAYSTGLDTRGEATPGEGPDA